MPVVRTDGRSGGRSVGVRSRDCQFFADFLTHGAPLPRFARESSAIKSNQSRRAIHVQEISPITDKTTYHTHRMIFDCRTCLVERMSDTNKDVDGDDDDDDDANNNE